MHSIARKLSSQEVETVRQALNATIQGSFFPDWEFQTLIGVERDTVRKVHEAWPEITVDPDDFVCAVINSINNLLGYPHGKEDELTFHVPEGRLALDKVLLRLISLGL